jgi:hypothetical protein
MFDVCREARRRLDLKKKMAMSTLMLAMIGLASLAVAQNAGAQNAGAQHAGISVGAKAPDLGGTLDQSGKTRDLMSLMGDKGVAAKRTE